MDGRIETSGDLTIEGRCDGAVNVEGTLVVASGAICRATIRAQSAQIYGEIIGDVVCTTSIAIGQKARIVGNVRAPDVEVDATAQVEGKVDLLAPAPEDLPIRRIPLDDASLDADRAFPVPPL